MFGTSGVRGPVGEEITVELAVSLGRALGSRNDRVVVGRDARTTGPALARGLVAGLQECGADVVDLGRASTPATARAVAPEGAGAGVSVTASHNPAEDNGFKLWTPSGQAFDSARQEEVARVVREEAFELADWAGHGGYERWDGAREAHRQALVDAGEDLSGLRIVVDIGNGMGGVTADALYDLGAAVETLNAQEDGRFPGRPSEPNEETLDTLCEHVAATGADVGIAHDGDADRMVAVDDGGEFVPKDLLLALFAASEASDGERVAAPVDTSLAVDDAVAPLGASVTRTRVGDVYVAERTRESDVCFGGEPSGAWIWPEETLCPDGPLAAVKLAALVRARPLSERLAELDRYPIRRENVETADKAAVMERVAAAVDGSYDDVQDIDGVRVGFEDGWFLVRASGTQPLIRLTAEAREEARAEELLAEAEALLEGARAE